MDEIEQNESRNTDSRNTTGRATLSFLQRARLLLFFFTLLNLTVLLPACSNVPLRPDGQLAKSLKLEEIIDLLESSDKTVRLKAIKTLGERRDPRAINVLTQQLRAESWPEREAAVLALAEMRDPLVIEPLFMALEDGDKFVAESASKGLTRVVVELGKKADPRMIRAICEQLSGKSLALRQKAATLLYGAVKSLNYVAADEYLKYIFTALTHEHRHARQAAAVVLREINHPSVYAPLLNTLHDPVDEVRLAAAESLALLGTPKDRNVIIETMVKGAPFAIRNAALLLSKIKEGDYRADTLALLRHASPNVREGAIYTLMEWAETGFIEPIEPLLNDHFATVRLAAANGLEKLGWTPKTEQDIANVCIASQTWGKCRQLKLEVLIGPLLSALQDRDPDIRQNVSEILLALNWAPVTAEQQALLCVMKKDWDHCVALGVVAIPVLGRELSNFDLNTRLAVIASLGKIHDPSVVPYLSPLITDDDQDIRHATVVTLGLVKTDTVIAPLIFALDDSSQHVRLAAVNSLTENLSVVAQAKDIRLLDPVIKALQDNNGNVRKIAAAILGEIDNAQVVQPLIDAMKDPDPEVRAAVSKALKKIKNPATLDAFVASLTSPNKEVRRQAVVSLGDFKSERNLKHFNKMLTDPDASVRVAAVQALGKLGGEHALASLTEAAKDLESEVRMQVAVELASFNFPEATLVMLQISSDFDKRVRDAARDKLIESQWIPANDHEKTLSCIFRRQWHDCTETGITAVQPLIEELNRGDAPDREEIIKVLGKIANVQAVEPILNAMKLTQWEQKNDEQTQLIITFSQRTLLQIGKQGADKVSTRLVDWYMGPLVVGVLSKFGFQARSEQELIHYFIAKRDGKNLRDKWTITRKVLIEDLKSKNDEVRNNALYASIGIGNPDIMSYLLELLNSRGNLQLAEAYLNCGNPTLEAAASEWSIDNGYAVQKLGEGNSPVRWGAL